MEDVNALILMFDSEESRKTWHSRLQGAVYRASVNLLSDWLEFLNSTTYLCGVHRETIPLKIC